MKSIIVTIHICKIRSVICDKLSCCNFSQSLHIEYKKNQLKDSILPVKIYTFLLMWNIIQMVNYFISCYSIKMLFIYYCKSIF